MDSFIPIGSAAGKVVVDLAARRQRAKEPTVDELARQLAEQLDARNKARIARENGGADMARQNTE